MNYSNINKYNSNSQIQSNGLIHTCNCRSFSDGSSSGKNTVSCNCKNKKVSKRKVGPNEETRKRKVGPEVSSQMLNAISVSNKLRKQISKYSSSVRGCAKPIETSIGASMMGFRGLSTCKNKLCPCCLRNQENKHKKEIKEIIDKALLEELKVIFLTLTHQHRNNEKYDELREEVSKCLKSLFKDPKYRKLRKKYDVKGMIKKMEATFHSRNGFHNHVHLLLILDSEEDTKELTDAFYEIWERHHFKKFGKKLSKKWFVAKPITNEAGISNYMSKSWSISDEMTQSSKKNSEDSSKGIHPIYLIQKYEETGDKRYLSAFLEYDSSKCKKSIFISPSLRKNKPFSLETCKEYDRINYNDRKESKERSEKLSEVLFSIDKNLFKIIAYNNLESGILEIINSTKDDHWRMIYNVKLFLDSEIISHDVCINIPRYSLDHFYIKPLINLSFLGGDP